MSRSPSEPMASNQPNAYERTGSPWVLAATSTGPLIAGSLVTGIQEISAPGAQGVVERGQGLRQLAAARLNLQRGAYPVWVLGSFELNTWLQRPPLAAKSSTGCSV